MGISCEEKMSQIHRIDLDSEEVLFDIGIRLPKLPKVPPGCVYKSGSMTLQVLGQVFYGEEFVNLLG